LRREANGGADHTGEDLRVNATAGHCAGTLASAVRRGDEILVFLQAALKLQELVIAAAPGFRIAAAGRRPRVVDRTVPLLDIKELADMAEMRIGLAPHRVLLVLAPDRVALLGLAKTEAEILGEALHIALVELDDRIGAAIAGAFRAIVKLAITV